MRNLSAGRLLAAAGLIIAVSVGCSGASGPTSGTPTTGPTAVGTTTPTLTPGEPSTDSLCASFTEALAAAALGVPLSAPTSGDVVPRPNGIYCHYAAADNSANTEAQLKDMTQDEFVALAENIETSDPVSGVGEMAFKRDTSIMGDVGVTLAAWAADRGVTVSIFNRNGQQAPMLEAAKAIAQAVLAH